MLPWGHHKYNLLSRFVIDWDVSKSVGQLGVVVQVICRFFRGNYTSNSRWGSALTSSWQSVKWALFKQFVRHDDRWVALRVFFELRLRSITELCYSWWVILMVLMIILLVLECGKTMSLRTIEHFLPGTNEHACVQRVPIMCVFWSRSM